MISVIIPLFNTRIYLEQTLEAFVKQTCQDFELIIIDDASEDNPYPVIIQSTKKIKSKVHYYRLPVHKGASTARNTGLTYAQGELVCFVDSDDVVSSNFIEDFLSKYKNSQYDMCFCKYCVQDNRFGKSIIHNIENNVSSKNAFLVRKHYLMGVTHICHCATVFQRDFLLTNNLCYAEGCRCAEDTELICKALFIAKRISSIDEVLYTYRQRESSISHSIPDERFIDAYYAMCRTQKSIPPLWRPYFFCTKRSRIHSFIIDQFLQRDMPIPWYYCSKIEIILCLGLSIIFSKHTAKHRHIFINIVRNNIRFGKQ